MRKQNEPEGLLLVRSWLKIKNKMYYKKEKPSAYKNNLCLKQADPIFAPKFRDKKSQGLTGSIIDNDKEYVICNFNKQ